MKKISQSEDHLGYWLRCAADSADESLNARFKTHDVTLSQWGVMRGINGKGDLTLSDAAKLIGVDASTLSRLVERMVHKGLINRLTDPIDRRAVKLSLTRKGAQLLPQLAAVADDHDEAFFASLSASDKALLLKTVKALLNRETLHG